MGYATAILVRAARRDRRERGDVTVGLPPRLEAVVQEMVESGKYADAEAVLTEALRVLDERDRLEWLRAAIDIAEAEIERGEVVEWMPVFFARLKSEAIEATRNGIPVPDDVKP